MKSILKWYQAFDIDLNARDWRGRTPLTFACFGGHTEVVQVLLETPEIDVNTTDDQGWTTFMFVPLQENESQEKKKCRLKDM